MARARTLKFPEYTAKTMQDIDDFNTFAVKHQFFKKDGDRFVFNMDSPNSKEQIETMYKSHVAALKKQK